MEIRIRDVNKTPIWAVPHIEKEKPPVLFLSAECNDFIEVDYKSLTPYQQQTVWSALKMKTLEARDDTDFQEHFRVMLKDYLDKRQKNQSSQLREVFGIEQVPPSGRQAINAVARANEIKKIMDNSVSTLKRLLTDFSASDLEVALKVEQHGKDRKTVVSLISELIAKQTKTNASKIDARNAPSAGEFESRQVFKGVNRSLLSNVSGVRESEQEQVIIKI
jgi:hypothetical protein